MIHLHLCHIKNNYKTERGESVRSKALVSAITAFLVGIFSFLVLWFIDKENALILSILSGMMFYVLLFIVLLIYGKIIDKRYSEFEKELKSPIFYKTNGNFNLGNGKIKNGNIYFCDAGIICVCMEEKPYTLDEILLHNIDSFTYNDIQLNIFTNDGRMFVVALPKANEIVDLLVDKGWIIKTD